VLSEQLGDVVVRVVDDALNRVVDDSLRLERDIRGFGEERSGAVAWDDRDRPHCIARPQRPTM
jgi:hypothetical protein